MVSGKPRASGGNRMPSRKVPLKGQFVIVFVLLHENSTGCTPPIGSTISTVMRALIGRPARFVTFTVYHHRTLIFGSAAGAFSVALNGSVAAGAPEATPTSAAASDARASFAFIGRIVRLYRPRAKLT